MAKKIELTSEKNFIGDSSYKSDDGLVYKISSANQEVSVKCDIDARATLVHADIANEVIIDGKTYPVTTIHGEAFSQCTALEKVTLPANMKSIAPYSFVFHEDSFWNKLPKLKNIVIDGCKALENEDSLLSKLERVDYDSMDTFLGRQTSITSQTVFVDGQEITDLVIPEGITSLCADFLNNCKSLRSVTLPLSIKEIRNSAFYSCENLEKVIFPEGLQTIGSEAFRFCGSLKEVTLPTTLESIGEDAFASTGISEANIPKGCKISGGLFSDCKQLKKVVLPDELIKLPAHIFLRSAVEDIVLPATLQVIGDGAFDRSGITQIELPEGLCKIGAGAFSNTKLKEITIPSTVREIGGCVFDDCDQLAHVYSKITEPADCNVESFELPARSYGNELFYRQSTLHIPNIKGLLSAYKKKAAWKKFSVIVADL